MDFFLQIADRIIKIVSIYKETYLYCQNFMIDSDEYDFQIEIKNEDVEYESKNNISNSLKANKSISIYKKSYLEHLSIYRKISEAMLDYSTFLMHGSVIAKDMDHCYMFTGPSGTGKTTHTKLWMDNCDCFVVNGDKPLMKVESDQVLACGTPWCGKEGWNTNCMVPLKGIVILERAEHNSISEISFKEAFPILLQQTYRPKDAAKMKKTLLLLQQLSKHVKFYRMKMNNFEEDAFSTSYNALVGNNK